MSKAQTHPSENSKQVLLLDTAMPNNPQMEVHVLSCILGKPDYISRIINILPVEAFYDERNRYVYGAMCELFMQGKKVDTPTVIYQLDVKKELEKIGGAAYILYLKEYAAPYILEQQHILILLDNFVKRRYIEIGSHIINDATRSSMSGVELMDKYEKKVYDIRNAVLKTKPERQLSDSLFEYIKNLQSGKTYERVVMSGMDNLDDITGGFKPGNLIIIAARPSMGKTAMAINLSYQSHMPDKTPASVLFISLEMTHMEIMPRILSMCTGMDMSMLTGRGAMVDIRKLNTAFDEISRRRMWINDSPSITVSELRSMCLMAMNKYNLNMIVIDYLQLMNYSGSYKNMTRDERVGETSRQIKSLAKELNIPIILLSQINRNAETRHDKRPSLSDLRESGSIEQDADIVILLYRPEYYGLASDDPISSTKGYTEAIIAKNRNGRTGIVKFIFDGSRQIFSPIPEKGNTPASVVIHQPMMDKKMF